MSDTSSGDDGGFRPGRGRDAGGDYDMAMEDLHSPAAGMRRPAPASRGRRVPHAAAAFRGDWDDAPGAQDAGLYRKGVSPRADLRASAVEYGTVSQVDTDWQDRPRQLDRAPRLTIDLNASPGYGARDDGADIRLDAEELTPPTRRSPHRRSRRSHNRRPRHSGRERQSHTPRGAGSVLAADTSLSLDQLEAAIAGMLSQDPALTTMMSELKHGNQELAAARHNGAVDADAAAVAALSSPTPVVRSPSAPGSGVSMVSARSMEQALFNPDTQSQIPQLGAADLDVLLPSYGGEARALARDAGEVDDYQVCHLGVGV